MAYDIIIKSGSLLDGTVNSITLTDLGIKGDKITAIGALGDARADLKILAAGKYVAPGFIDITNHSDTHLSLFRYPYLESLLTQGITTIMGGNCGASLAPLGSPEALNAIRKWVDPTEININWAGIGEYLQTISMINSGVNYGTCIGYGTLRRGVIGDEVRTLSLEEREKIKFLLQKGMEEGAWGLSLGLAYGHERISSTEEIIAIAGVLQKTGGVIKIHLRSEGNELIGSVNEAIRIGRETGIAIHINHLKAIGKKAWPFLESALEFIRNARDTGLDITFDVSPYHTTGSPLYLLIPGWARQGGFNELFKRISDVNERKQILGALKSYTLHYDKIFITSAKLRTVVGHTISELAEEMGLPPEEAMLETIRANEGRVTIVGRTLLSENIKRAIKSENVMITTDGAGYAEEEIESGNLVHPRCFGAFPHFWHRFVQESKLISPIDAIKKMSALPAAKFGIQKRGILKRGNFADVVVFDPKLFRDRATYRNPFRYPSGMEWVIVNGKVAVENGKPLHSRTGKVLRIGEW